MQAILEVTAGPCTGRQVTLTPGRAVRIGRTDKSDFVMADDTFLSSAHFYVEWSGEYCLVHDLGSSNGTFLNAARISESPLVEGDVITAGQSSFALKLTAPPDLTTFYTAVRPDETRAIPIPAPPPPPLPGPPLTPAQQTLMEVFGGLADPLYAVLDLSAAGGFVDDLAVAGVSIESITEQASLVAVNAGSTTAQQLVSQAWGAGWGFYLTSHQPVSMVRNHLRRFQTLLTQDGAEFQFRFFNPALLRCFLPTLNAGEARTFFGPLSAILTEALSPEELILYMPGPAGVLEKKMPLRCE